MRVPWGSQNALPGLRSLKKNSSCSCKPPRQRPSTLALFEPMKKNSQTSTHLADLAMVALRGLGEEDLILGQLLLVGERDPVDALQRVVLGTAQEVRCRVLRAMRLGPCK